MMTYKLSYVINKRFASFCSQNHGFVFRNPELFWKFSQKLGFKSDTSKKDVLSYIASRNMRKTLRTSLTNENDLMTYQREKNVASLNLPFNWLQFKKLFSFPNYLRILKLHAKTILLRHLAKKQAQGKPQTKEELEESWGGPEAYKLITFITDDFDSVIEKNPAVLVFFSAYWCSHCSRLRKPYGTAAVMAKNANLKVVFATFDVTINPDIADEKGVIGIPIIKFYRSGKYFSTFKGNRTADALFQFAKNPKSLEEKKNLEI